ncbi:MAG: hypothetical protein JNM93_00655 [Bacteriovoracaceae bacterium]|nr:hypothetical protein [Bacteriovoracaceae bacterium]
MKKLLLAMLICLPLKSFAQWSGTVGIFNYEFDADGASVDAENGIFLGGLYQTKLQFGNVRTGVIYTQRKSSIGTVDFNTKYIDVPALYMHSLNQTVTLLGGPVLAFNLEDDDLDLETFFFALRFGANFVLDSLNSIDAFYEMNLTTVGEDATGGDVDGSGIGVAYVRKF